jgi:ribokinase
MRVAVVGHVEWGEFAHVERVPASGEIVQAEHSWEEVGGGGAVAAVQLARLAGECVFLTALGDDELGRLAKRSLERFGVRVEAVWRPGPQRRAFVHTDVHAERTITVLGDRIGPRGDDALPWDALEGANGVYLTAGDPAAAQAARRARRLVATVRAAAGLAGSEVQLDALVASANDAGEGYAVGDLEPEPLLVARSEGARGGSLTTPDGRVSRWAATPLPGAPVDAYGAGDSFAAGLTYGLAQGLQPEAAAALGARCGAACITGRGPYEGQLGGPRNKLAADAASRT